MKEVSIGEQRAKKGTKEQLVIPSKKAKKENKIKEKGKKGTLVQKRSKGRGTKREGIPFPPQGTKKTIVPARVRQKKKNRKKKKKTTRGLG